MQGLAENSHIVCMASLYGGTHRYLTQVAPSFACSVTFIDNIETKLASVVDSCDKPVRLVWIETPSNPTLSLVDIQAVADIVHNKGSLLIVDNTFLSPYIQNPLRHGADLVLHSVTKYINGHSVSKMSDSSPNLGENPLTKYLGCTYGCDSASGPSYLQTSCFLTECFWRCSQLLRLLACPPWCEDAAPSCSCCVAERVCHRPDARRLASCSPSKLPRPAFSSAASYCR